MHFVASLTVDASLLRKLLALWDASGDSRNPFSSVLVTPLFASPSTLRIIREELKDKRGATVYFDSGGYYAQQGKITFDDLYNNLRDYYMKPENQWADWYVLPDHVPTSSDDTNMVEKKVSDTVTAAKMFLAQMPSSIQQYSLPVIQGHSYNQINRCIDTYLGLGLKYFGYGSFSTSGSSSSINVADARSIDAIKHIVTRLERHDVRLHTFGVSTPPLIYAFDCLDIFSFDSLAWQRSAGYGKIYMPYTRAYNVSHRSTKNTALSKTEFEVLKDRTGHQCPFCEDFQILSENRLNRSLHNLFAIMETIDRSRELQSETITSLIKWKSQRYFKLLEEVYLG